MNSMTLQIFVPVIDRLKNSKQEHLALLGPSLPGSNGTITSGSQPISERTSSTALAPTLPPIPENMDPDLSETALESEYEDEELMAVELYFHANICND